jgi:hypothetical protein
MTTDRRGDARLSAARYSVDRDSRSAATQEDDVSDAGSPTMDQQAQIVENAIQQAIRNGDFDGLPGAGKPLPDLHRPLEPDWWIRKKIEREGLTGLAPPALTLRSEDAGLQDRLDGLFSEAAVREVLGDFNTRVREARRQLLGGPPVFTRPRDVDAEVDAWRERRTARARAAEEQRTREAAALAALPWRERRRLRRRA